MLRSEQKILITEKEIKPNRYAANALMVIAIALLLVYILNEVGVFEINKVLMRLCSLISLILLLIPRIIIANEKWLSHPASKYVIMVVVMFFTLLLTTLLNIHVGLVFILPMLLATQYTSYRISWMALISSCVCCVLSPILAYLWGTWSLNYLSGYIEILCSVKITTTPVASVNELLDVGKIALYLILPQLMILSAFGMILFSVTKNGIKNLRDQIQIIRLSESDTLTGLLNRNTYETNISTYADACKVSIACIYADLNGLHELNNLQGHAAGDKMLKSVADAIKGQFGEEDTYRIGGDEFLAFAKDIELSEVEKKVGRMKEATLQQGYHVSIGFALVQASKDINSLVRTAEQRMFEDKNHYYEEESNDRRKRN